LDKLKIETMTKLLPAILILLALGLGTRTYGQNTMIEIPIVKTGVIVDEETQESFDFSSDDAEQENDEIDALDDDDLDAGWEGQEGDANILITGLRFQQVTIPAGATIDSAWIVLSAHEGKSAEDVANVTITGEAADSAITFDEENLITDRPATETSVSWVVDEDWIIYFPYRSPDLKEIVQEIIDRSGWKSGNALALVLAGENQGPSNVENAREFESFENIEDPEDLDNEGIPGDGLNHPDRVPKLVVYYRSSNPTALKETVEVKAMKVFPNPVSGTETRVTLPSGNPSSIRLLDITGKSVRSYTGNSSTVPLDISGIRQGVYMLKAIQGKDSYVQKVLIK
jgi:hypothetical protein